MHSRRIDFKKYTFPNEVSEYELFIGPDGEYYKVKTIIESDLNYTHYEWAQEYLKFINFNLEQFEGKSAIFVLINYLGFIRYTHCDYSRSNPIIDIPEPCYYFVKPTVNQINSLNWILNYNKEYLTEEQKQMLENDQKKYEIIRQKVFEKIVGGRK